MTGHIDQIAQRAGYDGPGVQPSSQEASAGDASAEQQDSEARDLREMLTQERLVRFIEERSSLDRDTVQFMVVTATSLATLREVLK